MREQLEQLQTEALAAIAKASDASAFEALEIEYLGRKGKMSALMQGVSGIAGPERPAMGKLANEVKRAIELAFADAKTRLETAKLGAIAESEWLDMSAPGERPTPGHLPL